jgi:hypothetical protein
MMDKDDDDADYERLGSPTDYYGDDDEEDKEEEVLGHDAVGSSPLEIYRAETEAIMNGGISQVQAVAVALHISADPLPIRAGKWQVLGLAQMNTVASSPPKMQSSLQSTRFAPVVLNPMPTIDDAVEVDPNFFEGAIQAGAGP